jgi:hypothetical protein
LIIYKFLTRSAIYRKLFSLPDSLSWMLFSVFMDLDYPHPNPSPLPRKGGDRGDGNHVILLESESSKTVR